MSIFSKIPIKKRKRNAFVLSHDVKLSFNMGYLIPILCQEVVPGDVWKVNTSSMIRFAPLTAPVMNKVDVMEYSFYVPARLVQDNFKEFMSGGEDGTEIVPPPTVELSQLAINQGLFDFGSLADYLGLPSFKKTTTFTDKIKVSSLPFRVYQLIWNEYFRDQNLQDEIEFSHGDGPETVTDTVKLMTLRKKCWSKDYFTSALPFAQRGVPVTLPLTGDAEVFVDNLAQGRFTSVNAETELTDGDVTFSSTGSKQGVLSAKDAAGGNPREIYYDPNGSLKVNLSNVTASTVNDLRTAIRLQEFLETAARGGSRYKELLWSFFGVRSSDARLQRPEYLGGCRYPVIISEVLQTSETTDTSAQGQPAGTARTVNQSRSFKRFFEEHGYVMTLVCVMPKAAYQQGIPRMFQRFDRLEYFWPQFAHLGEQQVKNSELYVDPLNRNGYNHGDFGYQSRYAEYKYIPSTVHGDFRDTLRQWHMGRIFSSAPNLNASFVEADPTNRIFAVEDEALAQKLWAQFYFDIRAIRLMPKFGVPTL